LLNTASDLLEGSRGRPRQANLKRAVSTVYYSLFHCLARCGADLMIGSAQEARRQAAFEHTAAYKACTNPTILLSFSPAMRSFARTFADLQTKRHDADYDPSSRFRKSAVVQDVSDALTALTAFGGASGAERRAFVAAVLLRTRSR
jgi:hypothetical protein